MSAVTGSKGLDRALFAGVLAAMVLAGGRTLVYHTITPARVSVVAVAADGERILLETPDALKGVRRSVARALRRIRAFQGTPAALELTPPGGRLEWSIRYSVDSLRFDRVRVVGGEPADEEGGEGRGGGGGRGAMEATGATDPRGARAWLDGFLFTPVDARAAAWLRIAFAAVLPCFFWSQGLVPYQGVPSALLWIVEGVALRDAYWFLVVVLCVLLGLGWRSRGVSAVLVLVLLPLAFLSGGRQSRQVLLFALFAFSFLRSDALRFPWRAAGPTPEAGPSWPVRLLQLNLSILYGFNAVAKSDPAYLGGDVLMAMSVAHPNFRVDLSGGSLELGFLSVSVAVLAVLSTLTEYALALGFWMRRWRWGVVLVGVGFHVCLMLVVRILHLDLAAMFLYLAFLLPLVPSPGARSAGTVPLPSGPPGPP